jgi:hypothetical protein
MISVKIVGGSFLYSQKTNCLEKMNLEILGIRKRIEKKVPYERTNQFLMQSKIETANISKSRQIKIREDLLFKRRKYTTNPNSLNFNSFYMFEYIPREENLGIVWDRYPTTFILEREPSGNYIGLNFHFVPKDVRMQIFLKMESYFKSGTGILDYNKVKLMIPQYDVMIRRYDPRRFVKNPINIPYGYSKLVVMFDFYEFSIRGATSEMVYKMNILKSQSRKE